MADADVFAGIQFDAVIVVVPLVAAPDGHPLDHGTFGLEKKFNVHAPGLVSRKFLTVTLVQRTQRSRNGDPSIAGLQFAAGGILGRRYPK